MHSPDHRALGEALRNLIASEQYDEAQSMLSDYARAVTEQCINWTDEAEFDAACNLLRQALALTKARRAHYVIQIDDLRRSAAFAPVAHTKPDLDVSG